MDFTEIAFDAVQPMKDLVDEIAMDFPDDLNFKNRTVLIVSEDLVSTTPETHLEKMPIWTTTVEVTVISPNKQKAKKLCLDAFRLIIETFYQMIQPGVGPIHNVTRGVKECGHAWYGMIPIDGYCARRTLEIINTID